MIVSTYIVKKGDTLSQIAAKYNTTVNEIAKLNNIVDVNRISVGQALKLPQALDTSDKSVIAALSQCVEDIENLQSFKNLMNMMGV